MATANQQRGRPGARPLTKLRIPIGPVVFVLGIVGVQQFGLDRHGGEVVGSAVAAPLPMENRS